MIKRQQSAFTLIELLVVIVIVGILATVSVVQFNSYQDKARRAVLAAQISQEKKVYLAECVSQGVDICPVSYTTRKINPTGNYESSALDCEQVCAENDERLATIEESFWFAKNASDNCSTMWHYADNSAQLVLSGYPMYSNRTTSGCGPLNTGDVSRFRVWGTGGTIYHHSEIYPTYQNQILDVSNTPSNSNCACISYSDF